jgi:hypothetical protein
MRNMHYKYDHQDTQQTAMQHKPSHQEQIKHIQFILPNFPGIVSTDKDRKVVEGFLNYIHTSQMHNTRSLVGRGVARTEHPHPGGVALTRQNFKKHCITGGEERALSETGISGLPQGLPSWSDAGRGPMLGGDLDQTL